MSYGSDKPRDAMTVSRTAFLERVRRAVRSGNRAGQAPPPESQDRLGYQGGGPDPVARFRQEFEAAGGQFHAVSDPQTAVRRILELVRLPEARRVLLGGGSVVEVLELPKHLRERGVEVCLTAELVPDAPRDPLFAADVGIGGVDFLIAETGSIVVGSRPGEPRSLSLLPPVHIAVAGREQVLPDLFDLFSADIRGDPPVLPSCLTLITGPSKTGDIELRLVTGVHGPGEVHVVLIGASGPGGSASGRRVGQEKDAGEKGAGP